MFRSFDRRRRRGRRRTAIPPPAAERLEQRSAQAPDTGAGEDVAELRGLRTEVAAEGDLRIEVGGGHADVGAGSMQQRFRALNVGPLTHQLGRKAYRQLLRQGEGFELEVG